MNRSNIKESKSDSLRYFSISLLIILMSSKFSECFLRLRDSSFAVSLASNGGTLSSENTDSKLVLPLSDNDVVVRFVGRGEGWSLRSSSSFAGDATFSWENWRSMGSDGCLLLNYYRKTVCVSLSVEVRRCVSPWRRRAPNLHRKITVQLSLLFRHVYDLRKICRTLVTWWHWKRKDNVSRYIYIYIGSMMASHVPRELKRKLPGITQGGYTRVSLCSSIYLFT